MPSETVERIFAKFNTHYMFPEGHALAFAFAAYQMARLRRYHPLEFYVAMFNEQPMGFWGLDTLKQDARRLGLRLGLTFVKGVDRRLGEVLLRARQAGGEFRSIGDLPGRSGLSREALENLAGAGALDGLPGADSRRSELWQVGVGYRADVRRGQLALPLAGAPAPGGLGVYGRAERILDDYAILGLCRTGRTDWQ